MLLLALQATATKKKKSSKTTSCKDDSYSSEVIKERQISETCVEYEIKVSYNGQRTYGLSHYSIAIPCGTIKNAWNSEGWKFEFGKDKKTGVYGLKVDDIEGFGDRKADSFIVKFTWCSDNASCETDLGVVAYKYGQCVSYDTLSGNDPEPEPPQNCSSLLASLEKKNVTCPNGNDGELQVVIQEGKEPFVYSWSNGSNAAVAQNLKAGAYAVTIKDADGNTLTLNQTLTAPPAIVISETIINPTCSGLSDGSIDLELSGGTGSYNIQWNHGPTTEDQSNLAGGLYTVVVSDSLGCSAQKTFMLTNGTTLSAEAIIQNPSCSGNNGSIDITPVGGTAPYTYRWNTGATTQDLQNIGAGFFRVTITDANGCSAVKSQTLQINNTLSATYIVTPTSCLGDNSGAIDLTVSGGTAPYTTVWADGPTTQDRSGLTAGNYQVTVTDAAGCSRVLDISVYKKPLEVTTIVNQPSCSGETGSVVIEPTGGVPPYTYNWSNGDTDNTAEGLVPGVYSVTITDGSGCTTDQFFGIIAPVPMQVFAEITNSNCGSDGSFAISLTVFGGKYPYTYAWSNGATIEDISGISAGTYTVEITDAGGCATQKEFVIDPVPANGACLINAPTAPIVCRSAGNVITTAVNGATSYSWTVASSDNGWSITTGSTDSAAVYTAGAPGSTATFTLVVTKNGCTQTCSYEVNNGCIERDNTGGGDPSSSEPCTPGTPTTPPVVDVPEPPKDPEPEPEEPQHGCKPKVVHAYPNPFRDKVKFEWKATGNDHVRLEIYDNHGNRLDVVYQGYVKAGKHYSFEWSSNCLKDRLYYYRFTTSKGVDYGKLYRK
jgi:hypothetical protein